MILPFCLKRLLRRVLNEMFRTLLECPSEISFGNCKHWLECTSKNSFGNCKHWQHLVQIFFFIGYFIRSYINNVGTFPSYQISVFLNVSIIPDCYLSITIFVSYRPSVCIKIYFFGMIFVKQRLERFDSESDARQSDSYRSAPKNLMETHLQG